MKQNIVGSLGVALGLIALAIAIFQFWLGPFKPQDRPLTKSLTEKAITLKDSLQAKLKGDTETALNDEYRIDIDRIVMLSSITAAFLAIVCGVVSFLKREDLRYSASAAVIGGSALAFHFIIVAIGIAVLLVLIVAVINR